MADTPVVYSRAQHEAMIQQHGYPVYLLFIDLRTSIGSGFHPAMYRVLMKLAKQWGTAGTAMQHWAIMIDGHVYELARKTQGVGIADEGMEKNPTFKRPSAIPYDTWERDRQVRHVVWRKYFYTSKSKDQITAIAQRIAMDMQKYDGLDNNCQTFVTRLYDNLECGYNTKTGWAPMSKDILPKQIPIVATQVSESTLSIMMSGMMMLLTAMQI